MSSSLHDLVYPSAILNQSEILGVLYPSFAESQKGQFVQHQKFVFQTQLDRTEIQRCASNKIPVLLRVHSLQSAFDVFKMNGVRMILVELEKNKPVIDFGWMQKAVEEQKEVVFSLPHFQRAVHMHNDDIIFEYRKHAKLLEKSRVPFTFASFASEPARVLSAEESGALAGYLRANSFSKSED